MKLEEGRASIIQVVTAPSGEMTILSQDPGAWDVRSYDELFESAARRATGISERGIERGDAVALVARTTFDFAIGCLAILRRGAVVVPVATPNPFLAFDAWERQTAALLRSAGAKALLLGEGDTPLDCGVQTIDSSDLEGAGAFTDPPPQPTDVALIQFTSGSTSRPRGIVLEHGAVAHNLRAVGKRISADDDADEILFSWLPMYHDMGFINYLLRPLQLGPDIVLLPTEYFALAPIRWLHEMNRLRATVCSSPNFAFGMVARQLEELPPGSIDLSYWNYAGVGGEPVDAATLQRFTTAGARFGLRPGTCSPGYGLAEATCTVTAHAPGSGWIVDRIDRNDLSDGIASPVPDEHSAASFVSVGPTIDDCEVAIADENDGFLPDRRVGEILVKSPGLMRGYLNDPSATDRAFRNGWLRTGDRGYLLDGELFVTGRIKDIIIVNGRNYHAEDIEHVVETASGVRRGSSIAIPITVNGAEALGVLAESKAVGDEARRCKDEIASTLRNQTGLSPSAVVLLKPRTLPKTTSGKRRRAGAKKMFDEGLLLDIVPVPSDGPADELVLQLTEIWESILGVSPIGPADDFFELGGTSLQAVTVVMRIELQLGYVLPVSALLVSPTIDKLASMIRGPAQPLAPTTIGLAREGLKATIFGVHGGRGGPFRFRGLSGHLSDEYSFYAFQARGVEGRTRPHRTIEEMAAHYIAEMQAITGGPYLLVGYCFGALVAYEMAVQLQDAGQQIALLAILNPPPLSNPGRSRFWGGLRDSHMKRSRAYRIAIAREFYDLAGSLRITFRMRMRPRFLRRFMLAHARRMALRYRPSSYPGPVDYFQIVDDQGTPARRGRIETWSDFVTGGIRIHDITAPAHPSVWEEPWVSELAVALRKAADEALLVQGDEETPHV